MKTNGESSPDAQSWVESAGNSECRTLEKHHAARLPTEAPSNPPPLPEEHRPRPGRDGPRLAGCEGGPAGERAGRSARPAATTLRRQGEARHLPAHGGLAAAPGPVRLQAGAFPPQRAELSR